MLAVGAFGAYEEPTSATGEELDSAREYEHQKVSSIVGGSCRQTDLWIILPPGCGPEQRSGRGYECK